MNVFGFGGNETGYLPSTRQSCDAAPSHAVTFVFLIQKEASIDSGTLCTVVVKKLNPRSFRDPLTTSNVEDE